MCVWVCLHMCTYVFLCFFPSGDFQLPVESSQGMKLNFCKLHKEYGTNQVVDEQVRKGGPV